MSTMTAMMDAMRVKMDYHEHGSGSGTEDTTESTMPGAQEDAIMQEEWKTSHERTVGIQMSQLYACVNENTATLITTAHMVAVSVRLLVKTTKKQHHLEI